MILRHFAWVRDETALRRVSTTRNPGLLWDSLLLASAEAPAYYRQVPSGHLCGAHAVADRKQ